MRGVALPEPASIPLDMADHAIAVREPGQPAEGTVAKYPQGIHQDESFVTISTALELFAFLNMLP